MDSAYCINKYRDEIHRYSNNQMDSMSDMKI